MTDRRVPLVYLISKFPAGALGVTGPEKAVLLAMVAAMNYQANGYAVWPSSVCLADWTGFSSKTCKRARERLRELHLIKIQDHAGRVPVCIIQEEYIRGLAGGSMSRADFPNDRFAGVSSPSQRQLANLVGEVGQHYRQQNEDPDNGKPASQDNRIPRANAGRHRSHERDQPERRRTG